VETNVRTAKPICNSRGAARREGQVISWAPPAATAACDLRIGALDAKDRQARWKKHVVPAPGEPGSETWKDKDQWPGRPAAAPCGSPGSYDVAGIRLLWRTGNPVPRCSIRLSAGDNLYTNS